MLLLPSSTVSDNEEQDDSDGELETVFDRVFRDELDRQEPQPEMVFGIDNAAIVFVGALDVGHMVEATEEDNIIDEEMAEAPDEQNPTAEDREDEGPNENEGPQEMLDDPDFVPAGEIQAPDGAQNKGYREGRAGRGRAGTGLGRGWANPPLETTWTKGKGLFIPPPFDGRQYS